MLDKMLLNIKSISNNTLANLETRDVALWIYDFTVGADQRNLLINFLGLPWKSIVYEGQQSDLISELEASSNVDDALARKRGFIQIIDSDPSRIELPSRCLPVYLLQGRNKGPEVSLFEKRLRRVTMLEDFRRSNVRELIIISSSTNPIPTDLCELWAAGYRTQLSFVSDTPSTETEIKKWLDTTDNVLTINLVQLSPVQLIEDILVRYNETYPPQRQIIRMRDVRGEFHKVDVTGVDEIERPILDSFSIIEERDLTPLAPGELSQELFIEFFKDPEASWRPYAASLPWERDSGCSDALRKCLTKLDVHGSDENCIAYIASEPGAGSTTLARNLAWKFARIGYPVLLAKSYPFVPQAIPIRNYITRVQKIFAKQITGFVIDHEPINDGASTDYEISPSTHYETPWIIVFDTIHWQHRDTELLQFRNELAKSGRSVCILTITDSMPGLTFSNNVIFKRISDLNHAIKLSEARDLGKHLNEFLKYYGKARSEVQWDNFYQEHTNRYIDGIAAFWVTLSFWIQGQYDLSESIQQWVYSAFKEQTDDQVVKEAILQIAAMSSERFPLPQALLPEASGRWPVWLLLEDRLPDLSRLGLIQLVAQGERYWALVHDILGRLLINALFYDYPERQALGYSKAISSEHLRFLILRKISENPRLSERKYRAIGEDFATEIFKVDPDHGKNNFTDIWREVLDALNKMPQLFRNTSRIFQHHSAISRRRIAKLNTDLYKLSISDRVALLNQAINDIRFALLEIPYSVGSEPDLNLLNSLALAYFDLAEVKTELGASSAEIAELKKLANEATQKAYRESPNNSFVVETYVRSILQTAHDTPNQAMENCVKALGILYSALQSSSITGREAQLERLAHQAKEILFQQTPLEFSHRTPTNPVDVLVHAWLTLSERENEQSEWSLTDVPIQKQEKALEILAHPVGQTNTQILTLRYELTSNCQPFNFKQQITLLEPLTRSWMLPQLQLEYAVLLFQVGRANEGDLAFRKLRRLWQTSEFFVHVPERLHYLRTSDGTAQLIVHAINSSEHGTRAFAIVQEFSKLKVPFRPEEHGLVNLRPGVAFRCFVSFGINGPFLRPISSRPSTAN